MHQRRHGARDLGMPRSQGVRECGGQDIRRTIQGSCAEGRNQTKCVTPPDLDRNCCKTIDLRKKMAVRTLPRPRGVPGTLRTSTPPRKSKMMTQFRHGPNQENTSFLYRAEKTKTKLKRRRKTPDGRQSEDPGSRSKGGAQASQRGFAREASI